MKKIFLTTTCLLSLLFINYNAAHAKIWRVNNNPGVNADFTQPGIAVASTSVLAGDTLYIEGSISIYGNFTLTKKLTFIGTGSQYIGLQANPHNAFLGSVAIDSMGSGSAFYGIYITTLFIDTTSNKGTDNCTFSNCRLSGVYGPSAVNINTKSTGMKFIKSFISLNLANLILENTVIRNNLVDGDMDISNSSNNNILVRNNNIIGGTIININNAYFANNLVLNPTISLTNSVVKYNLSSQNLFVSYPVSDSNKYQAGIDIFQLTGSTYTSYYALKPGSLAINGGEPLNAYTPDCGFLGTLDPYVEGLMPNIPSIYQLTAPSSLTNASTIPVTISTRSNK